MKFRSVPVVLRLILPPALAQPSEKVYKLVVLSELISSTFDIVPLLTQIGAFEG